MRAIFLDNLEYPGEVFYWLILAMIPLFVMSYVWLSVYRDTSQINGFSLSAMVTYYFVTMIVGRLTGHSAFRLADMVNDGKVSSILLRPIGLMRFLFFESFGGRLINLIISIPPIVFVYFLIKQYITFPQSSEIIFQFLLSVVGSVLIYYSLGFTLGLISFWTLEIGSIFYFYYGLANFLGGGLIPISFFPEQFKQVLSYLPFSYIYYFPASIYLGKMSDFQIWTGILICFIWVIFINFINIKILKMGIKKYSSFGG